MLNSLFSAFLMYSRIPMPKTEWKEANRRYSLGFFPLVGAVIGGLLVLWRYICELWGAGRLFFAVGAVWIPVLVTGGIHVDGFCDVTDARASYADKAKRLEILSDPHIGSFAVIRVCLYFLGQMALFSEVGSVSECAAVGGGFVLSRALSGLSAILFKSAKNSGSLQSFVKPSHKRVTVGMDVLFAVISAVGMVVLYPLKGLAAASAAVLTFIFCRKIAYRDIGGYTGDVCGWFVQLCELAVLGTFIIVGFLN